MQPSDPNGWGTVVRLAERQHGRVSVGQLQRLGITNSATDVAVASGRLHRVHTGVYAVGYATAGGRHGRWMGAVLACGEGAVLSHRSAFTLWRIRDGEGPRPDVTVPGDRRPRGVQVHRAQLLPSEVTVREGVPVVTVARALVETRLEDDDLERAVREAQFRRLFSLRGTLSALERRPNRTLRAILQDLTPVDSVLGDRFLWIVRRYGLPQPGGQEGVDGWRVDFVWPRERVVVELDGRQAHETGDAFQRDRSQSNGLQLAGYLVLRFTAADLRRRPAHVARLVRQALSQASS